MLTHYQRVMAAHRAMANPLGRRRENRVSSCIYCGATLGIYVAGELPQHEAHACAFERDLYEGAEMLEELRVGRDEDDLDDEAPRGYLRRPRT